MKHSEETHNQCAQASSQTAQNLEAALIAQYGPMLSGEQLRQILGYPTMSAFRQALSRNTIPIAVFSLPNRRGKFALAQDVAQWLASQRDTATWRIENSTSN